MTTLYRPVLIESAEQAEALPIGTVVVHYPRNGMEDQSGIRVRGGWQYTGTNPDVFPSWDVVGMEALVPIEAEEEFSTERSRSKWSFDGIYRNTGDVRADDWDGPMQTRLVTPWEVAS